MGLMPFVVMFVFGGLCLFVMAVMHARSEGAHDRLMALRSRHRAKTEALARERSIQVRLEDLASQDHQDTVAGRRERMDAEVDMQREVMDGLDERLPNDRPDQS